jgi:hypothetical protein
MAKWLKSYRMSKASDRHDQPFTSWRAFCEYTSPWGLGYAPELIDRIVLERKTAQQRARRRRSWANIDARRTKNKRIK